MRVPTLAFVLCLVANVSWTQELTVHGVVIDDSGAALPGAMVVLTRDGGNPRETTSDPTGNFAFANVGPGQYRVRVELTGFQPADLALVVGSTEPPPVPVRLKIGFDEEVTIAAQRSGDPLSPSGNADAVEFDPDALRRLPLDMQNLRMLIENFTAAGSAGGASFVIDGVETDAADVPQAAIHRLTINRNPYTAEYKTPGKARVEIETELGSRRFFHGAGALFVRNSALDARNAFAVTTPDMSRLLSEASFGGPLPRRGWSFFTSGQALADNQAAIISARTLAGPLTRNVPTPERRTILFGRIDFRPGKTHALSARYDLFDDVERGHGVGGLRLADQAFTTTERRQRLQLDDRRVVSATFANDLRVDAADSNRHDGTPVAGQSIVVAGAFIGGASQTFTVNRSRSVQAADVASFTIGGHALRIGARTKVRWLDVVDGTNFGGTFRFASLGDFSIGRPALFSIRGGNPEVSFSDVDADVFAETDFRPRDSIGITTGLRYDWQSRVADVNNVAPRVSMAFAPGGKKLVFRVGGGLYYRSVPETAVARSRLFGAGGLEETTIAAPPFPLSASAVAFQDASLNGWQLDPALRAPMTTQATIGAERVLWRRSSIAVEYLAMRTVGALRAHDINAPAPTTLIRPNPRRLNVNQIESTGESRTDAMTVTFRGRIGGFKGSIQYALARTIDNSSGPFDLPADNGNFAAETGLADFDRRHRLSVAGTYGWGRDRVRLGTSFTMASAGPFDITTGSDDNHDLVANDRPAGVVRNSGTGSGLAQLDVRFTTVFRAPRPPSADPQSAKREQTDNLELNLDVFNALNAVNATTFVGVITSPLFGQPDGARPARSMQLSLRYRF